MEENIMINKEYDPAMVLILIVFLSIIFFFYVGDKLHDYCKKRG